MMRGVLAGVALIAVWVLLLGIAAGVPLSSPLTPPRQVDFDGSDFRPLIGAALEDGKALGVGAIASDGNALQSVQTESLAASELPILSYRFEDFPRTLELLLVFRRADTPHDVQTVSLPWPGSGRATIDLAAATPAWHGRIVELGFAEYATPQLVPPSIAFKPFRLLHARLAGRSWSAAPALLRDDWFGYRPWSLAAVNVVGVADDRHASLPATLVAGLLLSLAIAAWLLRWKAPALIRAAATCAVIGWALLDVRWLADLGAKHRLTEQIYGGKSWNERARLQPDEDIAGFAQLVRQQLGEPSARQRILVASDSTYTLLRLIYFLLPYDAAPLESALKDTPPASWPAQTIVVLCASKNWQFDSDASLLRSGSHTIAVDEPLFVGGNLGVYRTRGAAR